MEAQASRTTAWAMPARSPFGSQRLQARKPAASASAGLRKKRTFLRSGRGEGQPGRQYTPIVVTAYRKSPGWRVRTMLPEMLVRQPIDGVGVFHAGAMWRGAGGAAIRALR